MVEVDIHLRPLYTSLLCNTKCLSHWYAVSRACWCALIPLHRPSWPQIWGFRFTWGVKMMPLCHVLGWYPHQTTSYIHIRHIQSVLVIGMLSQGHVSAPLYHYTGQVGPQFWDTGSLVEWKWCHNLMFEANIHLRPLPTSILGIQPLVCCLNSLTAMDAHERPLFVELCGLAEKVANMSATCCHDSQMSAHFSQMPLLRRHNFDPDTFFVSGFANIHQIFLFSTRCTYGGFLCKFWYVGYGWGSREILGFWQCQENKVVTRWKIILFAKIGGWEDEELRGWKFLPCFRAPSLIFFFSQLTMPSPELNPKSPIPDSEHHISSGEGNQRKPEYIPCRILLGLSANTILTATRCVQPAVGQSRC